MVEKSLHEVTRNGYEVWRGTFSETDQYRPCSWEDLGERQRVAFMAVAAYATTVTIALSSGERTDT